MNIPQCFYRISIKGLVLDETGRRFLMVREENGRWELPGGGLDHGESIVSCLKREIREESGLEVTFVADHLSFFFTCKKDSVERPWIANAIYEIKLANLNFTPSSECVEVRFFTPEEAQKLHAFANVHEFAKLFAAKN